MIYLRADGSAVTGAGHLMRCLTIAQELKKLPQTAEKILFLCADEMSAELVKDNGFQALVLGTDAGNMEAEKPILEQLFAATSKERVFLVDSYHVTDEYLQSVGQYGSVYWLDDLGAVCRPVDGVINYNAFAREDHYRALYESRAEETNLYIGSAYVPVREQFRNRSYEAAKEVKRILITTGGGDSENIAGKILAAIRKPGLEYHVVVGRFSPHFSRWQELADRDRDVVLHYNVKDMAGLMESCDLAVTAGGTTVYELAAIGVPFVCFSYAENQEALAEYVGKNKIAGFGGAYHQDPQGTVERIACLIGQAVEEASLREAMCEAEKKMIDGLGAMRIACVLADALTERKSEE